MQKLKNFIFGTPISGRLPERIAEAIARQQMESEKLIGWVQLLLAIILGSLWAVSPPALNPVNFQPVPWAVGMYALFTLVRLLGAYKGYLPDWLLMASVIIDMGMLMVLIWSFHIQYMQPPSFYLKAPTLMYVFIFIALRALRFEPKYIFIAGLSAIVGWGALMAYVMFSVPEDMMITRNYVTYLTSNSILIGAEIDKILSIVLVTVVLGTATLRGQRAFMRAVLEKAAADDLSRFISPQIAKRITEADRTIQPGDGELRHATVMFTDIEGFSTASEKMSPQELACTLNEYFRVMHEVLERFGGVITQFQGDAMLVVYNALTTDTDHPRNALRSALAIQDISLSSTFGDNVLLKTRCGIHTGDIMVGAVGAEDHLLFTVHGDNVNIAARLEQLNKEYGTYIMLSGDTMKACGPQHSFQRICNVTVRGRTAPTDVYTPTTNAVGS